MKPVCRRLRRTLPLLIVLLAGLNQFTVPCTAEYLLDTARQFPFGDGIEVICIEASDVNSDGVADLVGLVSWYQSTEDAVVVRLGTGNGEFTEPAATVLGNRSGYSRLHVTRLDGDPYPDLVLDGTDQDTDDPRLRTLVGNGDGTFSPGATYIGADEFLDVEPGDFTGDGTIDIVATEGVSVRLYVGQGDGTFSQGSASTVGGAVWGVAGGDFNEDGDLDLVTRYYPGSNVKVAILLNDGSGNFNQGPAHDPSGFPVDLMVGDLSGDGHLDVLAEGSDFPFFKGNGDGTIDDEVLLLPGWYAGYVRLEDIDEDGHLDIMNGGAEGLIVFLNEGNGAFGEPEYSHVLGGPFTVDDMNGDGNLDLVLIPYYAKNQVGVLPGRADGTFRGPQLFVPNAGESPVLFAADDMNGDGLADFVVGYHGGGSHLEPIQIFFNEYPGGFSEPFSFETDVDPSRFITSDMNGDGISDLLIIDSGGNSISIMLNSGDGSLLAPVNYTVGEDPGSAALGDLDGDGDADIAVAHHSTDNLGILLNNGDGSFGTPQYFTSTDWAYDIALGDLDGDGDLDAVVDEPEGLGGNLLVLKNNGVGSFAAPQRYDVISPYGVALDDHDHDGDLDMATGSISSEICSVLMNMGDGTFAAAETFETNQKNIRHFTSADMTNDGHADLLSLSHSTHDLMLLPGEGDGSFGSPLLWTIGRSTFQLAVADMDLDQDLEAIILGGAINIVYNNTAEFEPTGLLVTGPGPGEFNPTLVRVYGVAAGRSYTEWSAYGVDRWGVNVALGELDGTAGPEVLTGAGPGAVFGPHVRGFQHDGTPLPGVSFLAYGTNKWGVNVCSGDLDADGFDEIVTGAGPGAVFGPHVRGWNWDGAGTPTPIPGISYFAYGTPKWGVNVSCGDIDGDGYDEIVTGAGPGAVYGPHVRGWNCDGGGAVAISGVSFLAYGTNKYGVNVSCGDIDGDGIDEMVTGAGPGAVFGPHVRAWNWDGTGTVQAIGAVSFFAYDYTQWGANVSCGDLDGDGMDEIITGPGPGESHAPRVRGWNYDGLTLTALSGVDFNAYSTTEVTHGVKVGGLRN